LSARYVDDIASIAESVALTVAFEMVDGAWTQIDREQARTGISTAAGRSRMGGSENRSGRNEIGGGADADPDGACASELSPERHIPENTVKAKPARTAGILADRISSLPALSFGLRRPFDEMTLPPPDASQ
jgi:hypothetical protein